MNEAQDKPKKKWYKKRALILAVVLILAVASIYIIDMSQGRVYGEPWLAYVASREQIQYAVTNYSETHNSSLPTFNNTTWDGTCKNLTAPLYIVNLSQLLTINGGLLRSMPSGVYGSSTPGCDNCGGGNSNDSVYDCSSSNHYLWLMDQNGTVESICIGKDCKASNVSGYQGVWP
jgi:hypothetical protein